MNILIYTIALPIIAGIAVILIPNRVKAVKEFFSLVVSGLVFALAIKLFISRPMELVIGKTAFFAMDNLAAFAALFIALFGFLGIIYSIGFMKGKSGLNIYYGCILLTIGASIGAVLANDLILFLSFWGFLGVTLYLLIDMGKPDPSAASKKTLIIIGGADALMILGIGIVWYIAKSFSMNAISIPLNSPLAIAGYFFLASGVFAKAGVMPLHTWLPDSSEVTPVPVMGLIPASLDKLLGIYFLARLSLYIFDINTSGLVSTILLIIGSITILGGVLMALVQHDFKKLLAYHAVSQVGYMVIGIGTGNPIGIAGGLFHMLNNAIFKYGLFLSAGAVEAKKGTTNLDDLGGLSRLMPVTYITTLIAALAISGIPPFNGFFSKWMVYQGIIEFGKSGGGLWVAYLAAAIFGSALTLASFMKIIHAVFLGQCKSPERKKDEVGFSMQLPMIVLAALSIVFGVFALQIPIRLFIQPAISGEIVYSGVWNPGMSTGLILIGLVIGFIFYVIGNLKNIRVDDPFIGGEPLTADMKISGVDFYKTIEELPVLSRLLAWAKKGYFDIYDQGSNLTFFVTRKFQKLHNGVLPTYLAWCLVGAIVLFIILR